MDEEATDSVLTVAEMAFGMREMEPAMTSRRRTS